MASAPPPKKQRTDESTKYTLMYHAGIPGRGEPIRLAFEATSTPYVDSAKTEAAGVVYSLLGDKADQKALDGNTPPFAPPILRVTGAGKNGKDLVISQTANILSYLGAQLGLAGVDDADRYHVHQLALTALDLLNEAHDTHHPIAVMDYYEDQKEESLKKSADFRKARLPKFLGYFDRVLKLNEEGNGLFFVGSELTYADLVIWQVLDG
jgi:glutathione S-transferase